MKFAQSKRHRPASSVQRLSYRGSALHPFLKTYQGHYQTPIFLQSIQYVSKIFGFTHKYEKYPTLRIVSYFVSTLGILVHNHETIS